MSQPFADRSRSSRLPVLFAAVSTLAACGGGGGGGGDAGAPAPAPPSIPPTYAECVQNPSGVTNTYLNTPRPKREWKASTFLGEATVGQHEYTSTTATQPALVWHFKYDTAAQTVTSVGLETFNGSGTLTGREQFVGLVNAANLSVGQSETVNYTVKTLVPAGQPDRSERLTTTFEANEIITLPGGRADSCRVKSTLESLTPADGQLSVETLHFGKGLGLIKSYFKPTWSGYSDRNQTYLTELVSTTGTLPLATPTADMAPSLTQCSALPVGQNLVLSASSAAEANTALLTTVSTNFNGQAATAVEQRNAATSVLSRADFFDPGVGFLRPVGLNFYGAIGGTILTSTVRSGRPDLRTTPPLSTVNYTETFTTFGGGTDTSADSFTFEGYAKITTPAGTFDTCKVRFNLEDGEVTTFYLAPSLYWVRLDTTKNSVRTTRELISK